MSQWFLSAKKADFNKIAEEFHVDPVIARIIRNRDIEGDEAIRRYLTGGREDFYLAAMLKDMEKSIHILKEKIEKKAKIRVIGDYDADGICASYILIKGLKSCGADADTVIPHRMKDGYGLNESLIEEANADGIDTIVTCDNGIAAAAQIAYAKTLGMTVIITDHHEVPFEEDGKGRRLYILPQADAVIDPKQEDCDYPFKGICGSVVAFKLITELFAAMSPVPVSDKQKTELTEEFLEIAAFATVCDVMELRDENRNIVKCGLENMCHTRNIGLQALMEVCGLEGKKLTAYHIGFVMGPCLNATGRLDTAQRALSLLESRERAEAVKLAAELKDLNDSRKELTVQGTKTANEMIERRNLNENKVMVVYIPECHESLAGIIAGRIREKYGRPTFVLTKGEEGVKGSGRSIEGYHMYEEMSACRDLFTKFGGHRMAAGLSMREEDIDELSRRLNEKCQLTDKDFEEKVHIDVAMPLSYITKEFVGQLTVLEPFGIGNSKPIFAQKKVHIISGRIMGKNQNVGKYSIIDEQGNAYEMIYFGDLDTFHEFVSEKAGSKKLSSLLAGSKTDIELAIAYYPSMNSYGGRETLQINMLHYS